MLYKVVLAVDSCGDHSNPPLLVDRITPSPPTAQPWRLSFAKLIELIELPGGRGFGHCQPLKGSWAREADATSNNRTQQTDDVSVEAVEACFVLNRLRGTIPIQKRLNLGRQNYKRQTRGKANCPSAISVSLSIHFQLFECLLPMLREAARSF